MSRFLERTALGDGREAVVRCLYRCPATGAELVDTEHGLVCCDPPCRLHYPVLEGIPVLLMEEAVELSPADWAAAMAAAGHDPVTGRPSVADRPSHGCSGG